MGPFTFLSRTMSTFGLEDCNLFVQVNGRGYRSLLIDVDEDTSRHHKRLTGVTQLDTEAMEYETRKKSKFFGKLFRFFL